MGPEEVVDEAAPMEQMTPVVAIIWRRRESVSNEVLVGERGLLKHQARESDADGYAIYFILATIIDSAHERSHLLGVLGHSRRRDARRPAARAVP
jgi:hypothetical protein